MSRTSASLTLPGPDDGVELDADRLQGSWTEARYPRLPSATGRLLELVDGRIEVAPMPTDEHQTLVKWLLLRLVGEVRAVWRGAVRPSPPANRAEAIARARSAALARCG